MRLILFSLGIKKLGSSEAKLTLSSTTIESVQSGMPVVRLIQNIAN